MLTISLFRAYSKPPLDNPAAVEQDQEGADVVEEGAGEGGEDSGAGEEDHDEAYAEGEDDVLIDNVAGLARQLDYIGDVGEVVVHEGDVGALDGGV